MPLYWLPILPFLAGLILMLSPRRSESWLNGLALAGAAGFAGLTCFQVAHWLFGFTTWDFQHELFRWHQYRFHFTLHLDRIAAVFLSVTAVLGVLVVRFSQYYMHREKGQARFFATLMMLLAGMAVVELAGDIDTLFVGWEFVGIASFLLIGFYREREQPVRNALKVYGIYRLCDIGILVGAYLQHHDYGSSSFRDLGAHSLPAAQVIPIALLILLSAAGKSGQFPFSFWVPRAMEGPTPSSAIFYGALSIHAGVFLLLRTMPIWSTSITARVCIGLVGFISALMATLIGHVQSNIKGQIGYGSVVQVGLMFVELALGWPTLVLFHFVGNASLRCYQLLVSPSVVAYLLKLQSSAAGGRFSDWSFERLLPNRWRSTLFVLATQEGYMEQILNRTVFALPQWSARHVLDENHAIFGVWTRSLLISLLLAVAVAGGRGGEALCIPFVLGLLGSYALGLWGLSYLPREAREVPLDRFHGLAQRYPAAARLFFFSFLGMSGFPITPAFFGEDLLLSSAIHVHPALALTFTLVFMLNGVALARAFTRLFLGPLDPLPGTVTSA